MSIVHYVVLTTHVIHALKSVLLLDPVLSKPSFATRIVREIGVLVLII